jgi:type III secretory pathway component EscT
MNDSIVGLMLVIVIPAFIVMAFVELALIFLK